MGQMTGVRVRMTRSDSSRGEWSRGDYLRNYRICSFNHAHHGGVHVHHPDHGAAIGSIQVGDAPAAERVIVAYAPKHDTFNLERLREEAKNED